MPELRVENIPTKNDRYIKTERNRTEQDVHAACSKATLAKNLSSESGLSNQETCNHNIFFIANEISTIEKKTKINKMQKTGCTIW